MAMPAALARYHAKKSTARAPRRGPSPIVAKLRDGLARANKRARNAVSAGGSSGLMKDGAAFAGGFGYGVLEPKLPDRLGAAGFSVPTSLVTAAVLAFGLPKLIGRTSTVAKLSHDATLGVCGVAGYKLGSGTPILGEDDGGGSPDDDLSGGGWTDA